MYLVYQHFYNITARFEEDADLTTECNHVVSPTVNIISKSDIVCLRCSDTLRIANSISREMSRTSRLLASPTLLRIHLYLFTFHPELRSSRIFRRSSCDRCLCQGTTTLLRSCRERERVRTLSSPPTPVCVHAYTRTLDACTCIYQDGWRVTRRSPVIRMNHGVAPRKRAPSSLGLRISLRTPRLPYAAVPGVSELHNTRACRAQANRRAYSSRVRTRANTISPPSHRRSVLGPRSPRSLSRTEIMYSNARHPGKFKDVLISPFISLYSNQLLRLWTAIKKKIK